MKWNAVNVNISFSWWMSSSILGQRNFKTPGSVVVEFQIYDRQRHAQTQTQIHNQIHIFCHKISM